MISSFLDNSVRNPNEKFQTLADFQTMAPPQLGCLWFLKPPDGSKVCIISQVKLECRNQKETAESFLTCFNVLLMSELFLYVASCHQAVKELPTSV